MFHGFEDHSVLYVLHRATKLCSLNQQEVLSLLQKSPVAQEEGEDRRGLWLRTGEAWPFIIVNLSPNLLEPIYSSRKMVLVAPRLMLIIMGEVFLMRP